MLTVIDGFTRECLAIDVGQSLKGDDVVNTLMRITGERGFPKTIKTDNGSEFISKVMDKWAYEHGVELGFSRPGKPTDNAKVESVNGRLRQECLNAHWFMSLVDAQGKIEAWRTEYNESWPYCALDWLTPAEFARRSVLQGTSAIPRKPGFSSSGRY
jgi:putative transposase